MLVNMPSLNILNLGLVIGSLIFLVNGFTLLPQSANPQRRSDKNSLSSSPAFQAKKSSAEYSVLDEDGENDDIVPTGDYSDLTSEFKSPVDSSSGNVEERSETTDLIAKVEAEMNSPRPTQNSNTKKRPEYGALAPGTVVQVQIGDLSLARKAWKKRRRTGSPLLVPCSVLNVDRQSMVRWNLIYLLEKFGRSQRDGIAITETELSKYYRNFLKYPLSQQATNLGYESTHDMILALFNKKVQESYGVRLVESSNDNDVGKTLSLKAPISRRKAQQRASRTPLLQFRLPRSEDHGDADTMTHTGYIRSRDESSEDRSYSFLPLSAALRVSQKDDVDTGRIEEGSVHPAVVFDFDVCGDGGSPLLTLSLNPGGVRESLKVKPDRKYTPIEHPRLMLNELTVGNGPYSAKVVKLLPGKALVDLEVGRSASSEGMVKVFGSLRFQDALEVTATMDQNSITMMPDEDDEDETEDVIGAALEDLYDLDDDDDEEEEEDFDDDDDEGGSLVDSLLSLREDSSFEEGTFEEDEDDEDITHLFQVVDGGLSYTDPESGEVTMVSNDDDEYDEEDSSEGIEDDDGEIEDMFQINADGSLTYIDPDTGESEVFDQDDEDFADMMNVKDIIDEHKQRSSRFDQEAPSASSLKSTKGHSLYPDNFVSRKAPAIKRLRVGDDLQVYIRSVSKQSSQFTVTMNPYVRGRKAKELKREDESQKKLARLEKKLGGSLEKIWKMEGEECEGTVKATSKTGGWVYVEVQGLPVGVATLDDAASDVAIGDAVRVRLDGIDEQRGQLSMHIINKLKP